VWAVLLDEGIYLASVSSMYRVLRAADWVRERRARAAHPPPVRPELVADGADQVWTWDITKLKGPWCGAYFDLQVMIDIFSRKAIHGEVHLTETGDLAAEFIEKAITANGGAWPGYIHADNGTSMTSKTVADLLSDLKITRSHSRPHLSNDNPYSEGNFKTSSTAPPSPAASPPWAGPGSSATSSSPTTPSIGIQVSACTLLRLFTPAPPGPSGHAGSRSWDAAFAARPDRFRRRRPAPPKLPGKSLDQQAPDQHRYQGGRTDKSSRLMSQTV
jgi:putative transposase